MSIITVARGTYSGGKDLGECVAGQLGIPCVSREIVVEAAEHFVVSEEALIAAMNKPPSFFDRFSRHRDMYLSFVRSTLMHQAAQGSFLYHGNAGHLLLADLPTVVRVRVVAPMAYRTEAAMKRLNIDQRAALAHIEKVDRERKRWTRFLYGVDWQDPSLYDLVINLERIEIAEACDLVCNMARLPRFSRSATAQQQIADQALSCMVSAELFHDQRTRAAELKITASAGKVTIGGKIGQRSTEEAIREIVERVPGVVDLELEVAVSSEVPG